MTDVGPRVVTRTVQAVKDGQLEYQAYTRHRIATCPPSYEFPVDRSQGGWHASRDVQLRLWREKYPDRSEESFTHPRVAKVLEEEIHG